MTTIRELVNRELSGHIDQFGRLDALNSLGYKMTFYGFIRKVESDGIIWEHNDDPKKFKIRHVLEFEPQKQRCEH